MSSPGSANQRGGQSKEAVRTHRQRWVLNKNDGWWEWTPDNPAEWTYEGLESTPWARVHFKLKDERRKALQTEYVPDHDVEPFLQLQPILKDATHLCFRRNFMGLEDVLKLDDDPVPALEHLEFSGRNLAPRNWQFIVHAAKSGKLKGLKELDSSDMGDAFVLAVAECIGAGHVPCLSSLSLSEKQFSSDAIKSVAASLERVGSSLRDLSLNCPGLGSEGLLALAEVMKAGRLRGLEILRLDRVVADDWEEYSKAIRSENLPGLKELRLCDCKLGGRGVESLAHALGSGKMESLTLISLRNCEVPDTGAEALSVAFGSGNLENLATIELGGNAIRDTGAEALAHAFGSGHMKSLASINLSDNQIQGRGAEALAHAFGSGNLENVTEISLAANGIGARGAEALGQALGSGNLKNLAAIDLRLCKIEGDKGVKALGHGIGAGNVKGLVEIVLVGNDIQDEGMTALATSLKEGGITHLLSLDLSYNSFTGKGVQAMFEALKSENLRSLKRLNLYQRTPSREVVEVLIMALNNNESLTAYLVYNWDMFPELDLKRKQLVEQNKNHKRIMAAFTEEFGGDVPMVHGNMAKVVLCGNPNVGKTTLRKSLERTIFESLCTFERRPNKEQRTRGIEITHLNTLVKHDVLSTLVVWDMAGQEEYHLVHNAFLLDLVSPIGNITTFVVVCSTDDTIDGMVVRTDTDGRLEDKREKIEKEMRYWLQFIASSCNKSMRRKKDVFVVLNCRKSDRDVFEDFPAWNRYVADLKDEFDDYLVIHEDLLITDVRKRRFVEPLKRCLVEHSKMMLKDIQIPQICRNIQDNLNNWSNEKTRLPVLHWEEFVEKTHISTGEHWPEKLLEAAVEFLHLAGVLIYIITKSSKLIVLHPNWICQQIVGSMLLPTNMIGKGKNPLRGKVDPFTGSISIQKLKKYFRHSMENSNWNDSEFGDVVSILLWLGLCFKGPERFDNEVFIPALIKEDSKNLRDQWDSIKHEKGHWVMGYSLERMESQIALAPMALWHKYQVELAQTYYVNSDNDFVVDKCSIAFNVDQLAVLIEVSDEQRHLTLEHVDVFVKPLREGMADPRTKQRQVDLASNLVERLQRLWIKVCPGIDYIERVVWPWPTFESKPQGNASWKKRNMKVVEIKEWVQGGRIAQWQVGGNQVRERQDAEDITYNQLLSTNVMTSIVKSVETDLQKGICAWQEGMKDAIQLDIFPRVVLNLKETSDEAIDEASKLNLNDYERLVLKKLEKLENIGKETREIGKETREMVRNIGDDLKQVLANQRDTFQSIQNVQRLYLEDPEQNCPRFIYVGKKNSGKWMKLRDAMSPHMNHVHVHFACEAECTGNEFHGHQDYGILQLKGWAKQHKVEGQEGIDISSMKDWARNIIPWLKVSLTVLCISTKVAANIVVPGVGTIIPNASTIIPDFIEVPHASSLAEAIAETTGYSLGQLNNITSGGHDLSMADSIKNHQELYGKSRKAMTSFLKDLSPEEFKKKIGLVKGHLTHARSTSNTLWLCDDCIEGYRKLDIQFI